MKPTGKTHKKAKKIKQPSEPRGCIYLLTNLVTGKRYVGQDQTGDPEHNRWPEHVNTALNTKDQRPLYRAIRKAWRRDKCLKNIAAKVIWRGPVSLLHEKEVHYIKTLHTFNRDPLGNRDYNLTKGGEGCVGRSGTAVERRSRACEI